MQCSNTKHPLFLTKSKDSYDVRRIREALSESQRRYLLFFHAFTGCDTFSSISSHGKTILFYKLCTGDIDEHMDIFRGIQATMNTVIGGGIAIFKYFYNARGTTCTLGKIWYNISSRKAASVLIKPDTLRPTEGAAAWESLHAYLQTQNWMLLQSMSVDPSESGWTIGIHGFKPVPSLEHVS